jgi:hypothetical protein
METTLTAGAYVWTAYCAVSHTNIDARKRNEPCTFREQWPIYIISVPYYWLVTFLILQSM